MSKDESQRNCEGRFQDLLRQRGYTPSEVGRSEDRESPAGGSVASGTLFVPEAITSNSGNKLINWNRYRRPVARGHADSFKHLPALKGKRTEFALPSSKRSRAPRVEIPGQLWSATPVQRFSFSFDRLFFFLCNQREGAWGWVFSYLSFSFCMGSEQPN